MKRQSSKRSYKGKSANAKGTKTSYPGDKDAKRDMAEENKMQFKAGCNDPAWYAVNPELLRDSASIPFSWAVGTPFNLNDPLIPNVWQAVPGLQVLFLQPTVGYSADPTSPINIAANNTYAFVRHANSGHTNYDAPDLMLYIIAMADVYSYINFLQRIYGTATLYAQKNRYLPDAIIKAQGVDPIDVRQNLAQFRYGINVLINKAASFAVPASMPIFKRRAFLYTDIFTEGTSIKDQLYLYAPEGFYKYSWDADNTGQLTIRDFYDPENLYSVESLLNYGNELLGQLIFSEDMNIMSGDILKAYQDNILKLRELPTDYTIIPIFDIGVLEQMKNGTIVFVGSTTAGRVRTLNTNITQNSTKAWLQCPNQYRYVDASGESYSQFIQTYESDSILTTTTAEVTPDLIMESTRLKCIGWNYANSTSHDATINLTSGSEIISRCLQVFFTANAKQEITFNWQTIAYHNELTTYDYQTTGQLCRQMRILSSFRFHPEVRYYTLDTNKNVYSEASIFDIDNYAILKRGDVERMHETALMSLLNVPSIAKLR